MKKKSKITSNKPTTVTTYVSTTAAPAARQKRKGRKAKGGTGLKTNALDYLVSSLFPSVQPSRIIDNVEIPTAVVSLSMDLQMLANAASTVGGYLQLTGQPSFVSETGASTDAVFAYAAAISFPAIASFTSAFIASRPVSASLQVTSLASTLTDQGEITAFTLVGNPLALFESIPTSLTQLLATRDNRCFQTREGCYVRYKSFDVTHEQFSVTTGSFTRSIIGFHASGLAAGTIMRVRLVANYECLPSADTLSFQLTSPSPSDPAGFEYIKSLMSKVSSFSSYDAVRDVLQNSAGSLMTASENAQTAWSVARRIERLYRSLRGGGGIGSGSSRYLM